MLHIWVNCSVFEACPPSWTYCRREIWLWLPPIGDTGPDLPHPCWLLLLTSSPAPLALLISLLSVAVTQAWDLGFIIFLHLYILPGKLI